MKKLLKLLLISICILALSLSVAACNMSSNPHGSSDSFTGDFSSDPDDNSTGGSLVTDEPYLTIVNAPSAFTIGDKGTFSAENSDDDDSVVVIWSVDNSNVLSVGTGGAYEALAEGLFTVTAQAEGYTSATLEGEVKKSDIVPMMELDESVDLYYGDKYQLIPQVTYDGEDVDFADLTVVYEVADDSVLSIDENGNVTALKNEECSTTVDVKVTYGAYTLDTVTVTVTIKTKTYITLNVYQNVAHQEGAASCIKRTSSKLITEVSVISAGETLQNPDYTLSVIEGEQFVGKSESGEYNAVADGSVTFKAECEINGQTYSAVYSVNVAKASYTCHDLTEENGSLVCSNEGCEFTCEKQKRYVDTDGLTVEGAVGCFVDGQFKSLENGKLAFTQKEIIEFNRQEKEIQFVKEDLSVEAVLATMYTKVIDSVEDLRSAKNLLDSEGRAYFKLEADLTVGEWTNSDCINEFNSGVFDGGIYDENGNLTGKHKLSGLTLTGGGEFGLFGFTTGSTFKNFEVEMIMSVSATNDGGAALIYQTAGGNIENVKLTVSVAVGVGASGDRIYGALIARQWVPGTTTIKNCEIIGDANTAGENSFAAIINVNMWQDAHIRIENVRIENFATALSMFNDPARLTAQEVLDGNCDKVTATNLTSEKTLGVYGNNFLDANGNISGFTIESGNADVYCGEAQIGSVSNGQLTLNNALIVGGEHRLVLKDSSGNAVSLFKNSDSSAATDKLNVMFVSKIIKTVDELKGVADNLSGAYLKLEADLTTIGEWNSSDCINEFNSGVFDGGIYDEDGAFIGKHKLSGLNLSGNGEFGLFGFTTSSTFKNFEVEMIMSVSATNDGGAALIYQTAGGNIENVKLSVSTAVGVGASGDRVYGALIARQWEGGTTIIKNCEIIGDSNTAGENSFAALINVNMWQDAHIRIENVRIENFATALSMFNDPARLTAQDVLDGKCDKVTATNLTSEKTVGVYGNNFLDANGNISGFTIESGNADVYCGEAQIGSVSNGQLTLNNALTVGGEYRLVLKDSSGNAVSLFKNSDSSAATDKLNVMFVSKIIKTVDELKGVADNLSGAYLKLEADLTVGDWTNGDCINEFNNSVFDGGVYDEEGELTGKRKLSGIVLKYGDSYEHEFGLFGFTTNSTFKNFEAEVTNNVSATDGGGAALIYQTAGGTVENVKLTLTVGEGANASGDRVYGALIARQWEGGTTIIKNCEIIGDSNTAGENSFAALINVNMWQDANIVIENVKITNFATALSTFNDTARLTVQEVLDGKCDKVTATNLTVG